MAYINFKEEKAKGKFQLDERKKNNEILYKSILKHKDSLTGFYPNLKYSFKRFIFREMFFHRDKKLKNNLMEALIEFSKMHDQKLTKKESKQIIEEYEIPKETLNKLMENLSNEEYELVYNKLK